jgi:hypothetical protein
VITKSFKDADCEIVIQQSDINGLYSVILIKNDKEVEFQGNLDYESASEVFDYYFDKTKGCDLKNWGIE